MGELMRTQYLHGREWTEDAIDDECDAFIRQTDSRTFVWSVRIKDRSTAGESSSFSTAKERVEAIAFAPRTMGAAGAQGNPFDKPREWEDAL